jgi:TatD DNase family protein
VDTHAHLDDPHFRDDFEGLIARARQAGLIQIIAIGTTAIDSASVIDIARKHTGVFAAVGVQPNHVAEAAAEDWPKIVALSRDPLVVAIGETGLDKYWDRTPFPAQQEWFDRHLALAYERDLPVVIHCRECEAEIVHQLSRLQRPVRGVLHSFTGSSDDVSAFVDLGLHISLAGMVTFANKSLDALRAAAACVPLDRILIETDSPYLSPHPVRGRRNQPAHLAWTATQLAQTLGLSADEFAQITTINAQRLFRLPAPQVL